MCDLEQSGAAQKRWLSKVLRKLTECQTREYWPGLIEPNPPATQRVETEWERTPTCWLGRTVRLAICLYSVDSAVLILIKRVFTKKFTQCTGFGFKTQKFWSPPFSCPVDRPGRVCITNLVGHTDRALSLRTVLNRISVEIVWAEFLLSRILLKEILNSIFSSTESAKQTSVEQNLLSRPFSTFCSCTKCANRTLTMLNND